MARWRGEFASWDKVPGEVVCELDLELDALLRDRLFAIDPEAGWLSEETADSAERLLGPRVWVVDPIDGTVNYLYGIPHYAISIAIGNVTMTTMAERNSPRNRNRMIATSTAPSTNELSAVFSAFSTSSVRS